MKICFIAPANNYHTQKWCHWFRNRGHQIDVISFTEGEIEGCTVHYTTVVQEYAEVTRKNSNICFRQEKFTKT